MFITAPCFAVLLLVDGPPDWVTAGPAQLGHQFRYLCIMRHLTPRCLRDCPLPPPFFPRLCAPLTASHPTRTYAPLLGAYARLDGRLEDCMAVWRDGVSAEQGLTMTEREYLHLITACTRAGDEKW